MRFIAYPCRRPLFLQRGARLDKTRLFYVLTTEEDRILKTMEESLSNVIPGLRVNTYMFDGMEFDIPEGIPESVLRDKLAIVSAAIGIELAIKPRAPC